jgi:hypothetical protein
VLRLVEQTDLKKLVVAFQLPAFFGQVVFDGDFRHPLPVHFSDLFFLD